MKGATGSPSDFSLSLCIKYSSRRQSTHGSETAMGRTSLEMSQHLIRSIFSYTDEEWDASHSVFIQSSQMWRYTKQGAARKECSLDTSLKREALGR